jgi:hypothetical protein
LLVPAFLLVLGAVVVTLFVAVGFGLLAPVALLAVEGFGVKKIGWF